MYSDCNGSVASADALEAGTYFVNVVQTTPEIGDVDFSISVDITIVGCTDPIASNYNLYATDDTDPSSCEYVYGCTDPIAENYNASANVNQVSAEDYSNPCEYVLGCTDGTTLDDTPIAINFDPDATQDDGSCEYAECLQTEAASLTTGSNASSVSISITDLSNQVFI